MLEVLRSAFGDVFVAYALIVVGVISVPILLVILGVIGYVVLRLMTTWKSIRIGKIEISRLETDQSGALIRHHWKESVGGEEIGFLLPRHAVVVYGQSWHNIEMPNNIDRINGGLSYLDLVWTPENPHIDVTRCNLISPMISLINKKLIDIPHIVIVCTRSQRELLQCFDGVPNVSFEIR